MKQLLKYFIISLLILPLPLKAEIGHPLITEIQIESEESTKHEFIELFNPTDQDFPLENLKLVKQTQSGNESYLVSNFKGAIIPP